MINLPSVERVLMWAPQPRSAFHACLQRRKAIADDRLRVFAAVRASAVEPMRIREVAYYRSWLGVWSHATLALEVCDAAVMTHLLRARGLRVEQLDTIWFTVTWPSRNVVTLPIWQYVPYAAGVIRLCDERAQHQVRKAA